MQELHNRIKLQWIYLRVFQCNRST